MTEPKELTAFIQKKKLHYKLVWVIMFTRWPEVTFFVLHFFSSLSLKNVLMGRQRIHFLDFETKIHLSMTVYSFCVCACVNFIKIIMLHWFWNTLCHKLSQTFRIGLIYQCVLHIAFVIKMTFFVDIFLVCEFVSFYYYNLYSMLKVTNSYIVLH